MLAEIITIFGYANQVVDRLDRLAARVAKKTDHPLTPNVDPTTDPKGG